MHEAAFYQAEQQSLRCRLCPHRCLVAEGEQGRCRVRGNRQGKLYALNYAAVSSLAMDPIEKKPLFHYYPGSRVLSVGTYGCNLACDFCQNWEIAQGEPGCRNILPEDLVRLALKERQHDSIGIAYTYSEPVVWFEYVTETARQARLAGLKNIVVTNGFIEPEPLERLLQVTDALNIDVKGFTPGYYHSLCHGRLEPVLRSVAAAAAACHLELTTLLVPGRNDGEEELIALCDWIASIDSAIPLHLSRYFPCYKLDLPPTPLESLKRARRIAAERLQFVYLGNAPELEGDNTYCPSCQALLVRRSGYTTRIEGLDGRRCSHCGREIEIVT